MFEKTNEHEKGELETCKTERDKCDKEKKANQDKWKREQDQCKTERDKCDKERKANQDKWKKGRIAVMIIASIIPPPKHWVYSTEVVPQSPSNLSNNDSRVLSNLNLPQDKWNNRDALLAFYRKTEKYDVISASLVRN